MSYSEYSKIEVHIGLSSKLSHLDKIARQYLEEIERKKGINGRKQYEKDVQNLMNILQSLSKPRLLNHNLYSSLHYYLDDLMYFEITEIGFFMVEDEKYPLSAVYFDKQQWLREPVVPTSSLSPTSNITVEDAVSLYGFFVQYADFIVKVRAKIENVQNPKIKGKISRILRRMEWRYLKGSKILVEIINLDFNKKIESYLQE